MAFTLFISASVAILWLSRRSLRSMRSHGFYRFFAFESLAGLVVLNLNIWFRDPFSIRQIVSYFFGVASILLAFEGFRLLALLGRPSSEMADETNLAFENTTHLVRAGVYRFIRHPLYASLFALAVCTWLKAPLSRANIALTLVTVGFLLATAVAEEKENLARFGTEYAEYMKHSNRFVPFLF